MIADIEEKDFCDRLMTVVRHRMKRHSFIAFRRLHRPDPFWVRAHAAIGKPIGEEQITTYGISMPLRKGGALHRRLLDIVARRNEALGIFRDSLLSVDDMWRFLDPIMETV